MNRRDLLTRCTIAVYGASLPIAKAHAQNRFAPFRGQMLNISIPIHPHYDAMIKLLPQFTEQTGIRVEIDRQPIPKMKERQLGELSKPQGIYDLVCYVVMWKGEYVKKKLIREIEPYFRNAALVDPAFDLQDIAATYLENIGLVGGWRGYLNGPTAKLYGLPYGAETSILAYRKDIFERLKLSVPTSYYQLEQLLPEIRDKSGLGALSSRAQSGHQCVHAWLLHLNPMGGKVFDVNWAPRFNDRAGARALKFLQLVINTGPAGVVEFGQSEMTQAFLQGETAMYLDSTVVFGSVRDPLRSKVDGKVGYARHPKATAHASQSGGLGLAIPTNARNADSAFLLMQWLTSKEQDRAVCRLGGGPTRTSTLMDEALARQFPEYLTMRLQLRDADPDWRPIIPEWDEINTQVLGVAINRTLRGQTTAEEALNGIVPRVTEIMRRGGYLRG